MRAKASDQKTRFIYFTSLSDDEEGPDEAIAQLIAGGIAGSDLSADTHNYLFNDDQLMANVEYYYRIKRQLLN